MQSSLKNKIFHRNSKLLPVDIIWYKQLIKAATAALLLAACSFTGTGGPNAPADGKLPTGDQGGTRKVGNPYKIAGTWYYPKEEPDYDQTGRASWYGPNFHGKRTANGETYNMNALTAAHRTLPLPSFVKVTNLENGRSIILRVNDRGPFAKGRIIDVSRRGAQLLGFENQGTARVRVQVSNKNGKVAKASSKKAELALLYVQVGSYSEEINAVDQHNRLKKSGTRASIVEIHTNAGIFWRVRVGPFKNERGARRTLDRLVADGFYEAQIFSEPS